jgi:AAA+ ATPase superfamily predicted ATPase
MPPPHSPNPFTWRTGITRGEDFLDRDREQRTICTLLQGRQHCQIVGPRRIGKTSLLLQIQRAAPQWDGDAVVALVDLQDPHCFTLSGWLECVGRQLEWDTTPTSLMDFADCVESMLSEGRHPVLCLDEFEELTSRRNEFPRDFFLTMRFCSQKGMSVITASRKPLNELTEHGDPTSPFYNIFPLVRLEPFSSQDAEDFVTTPRPGVPPFTSDESEEILKFAQGHPLALQVACFYVLESKQSGENLTHAMERAKEEMKSYLSGGEATTT